MKGILGVKDGIENDKKNRQVAYREGEKKMRNLERNGGDFTVRTADRGRPVSGFCFCFVFFIFLCCFFLGGGGYFGLFLRISIFEFRLVLFFFPFFSVGSGQPRNADEQQKKRNHTSSSAVNNKINPPRTIKKMEAAIEKPIFEIFTTELDAVGAFPFNGSRKLGKKKN